jgi:hypothetical protein
MLGKSSSAFMALVMFILVVSGSALSDAQGTEHHMAGTEVCLSQKQFFILKGKIMSSINIPYSLGSRAHAEPRISAKDENNSR